jgi:hypothetical protein
MTRRGVARSYGRYGSRGDRLVAPTWTGLIVREGMIETSLNPMMPSLSLSFSCPPEQKSALPRLLVSSASQQADQKVASTTMEYPCHNQAS